MSINSINSTTGIVKQNQVQRMNENNDKKPIIDIKDGKTKIGLALAGLAVVGATAVFVATKKRMPDNIGIEDFKKVGSFDKGIAKYKNKPYTGVIEVARDKQKFQLEYEKGVLKSSVRSELFEFPKETGLEPSFVNKIKKVYSGNEGKRTIELYSYENSKNLSKEPFKKVVVSSDSVVKTTKDSLCGVPLERVAQKQADGTWKVTHQEIAMPSALINKTADYDTLKYYEIHVDTIDNKTGEVIKSERILQERPHGDKRLPTEEERAAFKL